MKEASAAENRLKVKVSGAVIGTAILIGDEEEGVHVRRERRRGLVRVIDTGPLFRRGSHVATVPRERVTHGCDDQAAVGLARPDDRLGGASSNVREAEIKRVYWIPAADDRAGLK